MGTQVLESADRLKTLPTFDIERKAFSFLGLRYQSWSRGNAITTPKRKTTNSNTQVEEDCFMFFTSLAGCTLFTTPVSEFPFSFNKGFKFDSLVDTCPVWSLAGCSASCCCCSYLSTNSGNNFLKVALSCKES